jgi:hypothetical protein
MATIFEVRGPFEIPYYQGRAGRTITDDNVREFWGRNRSAAGDKGCYVFGVRAAKGFTPGYVGRATRAFRAEAFAPHKLAKYQQFLADYRKGTPVLFFVVAPSRRGAPNVSHIKELEAFLIQVGLAANAELLNVKGTSAEEWGIAGILRGGKGKPSASARAFQQMMKFR